MPKRRVVIELSATRLELSVLLGDQVVSTKGIRLDVPEFNETWPRGLESVAPQLKQLVTASACAKLPATLIYHAPTSAVIVSAVPAAAPRKESMQAAGLALADAANRPLAGHPHELERIWVDANADAAVIEAPAKHAHILGMADSEEATSALARLLKAADLRPDGLVPAETLAFISAVDAVLDRSSANAGTAVAIYFGEHTSVLAAATSGRLRFVRRLGTGSEQLIDALARDIRTGPDSPPITLTRPQAAALLFRSGVPVRGQPFDAETNLAGDAVLPLVQPVLQRCIVEIRQSIRFGLDEKERGTAKLIGLGIGARIGRLMKLISDQSAMPQDDAKAADAPGEPTSTSCGLIDQFIRGRAIQAHLLPASVCRELTAKRARRGMFVGFGAAAAMIVFNGVTTRMELPKQLERVQKAQANLDGTKPITDLNNRMIAAQAGVAAAK